MEQVMVSGGYISIPSGTRYNVIYGLKGWSTSQPQQVITTPGKIGRLRVRLSAAPGTGNSRIFTLMVNGAATALTCTISGSDTKGSDMAHKVAVVAGDYVGLRGEITGTPSAAYGCWSLIFSGDNVKESVAAMGADGMSQLSSRYHGICDNYHTSGTLTEANVQVPVPTPGKIKNLYVRLLNSPGASPKAYRFTLRKNGADTDLVVTITGPNTTGNDTVHEVTVAAGDKLSLKHEPLNSPDYVDAYHGITFLADTDGEAILWNMGLNPDQGNTEYARLNAGFHSYILTDEYQAYQLGQLARLKKFYVIIGTAPGVGKSWTWTIRKNGANTTLTVTIADDNVSGNDTTHEDTVGKDDYLNLVCVPANTPTGVTPVGTGCVIIYRPIGPFPTHFRVD